MSASLPTRARSAVPPPLPRRAIPAISVAEPQNDRVKRIVDWCGDYAQAIVLSAILHLTFLLALSAWKLMNEPPATGFVINSTIITGDEGALPEIQSIIDAPLPSEGGLALQPDQSGAGNLKLAAATAIPLPGGPTDEELGFGALGRGSGAAGGGVGFFGTKAAGNSFVFVVDCSGSMKGQRFQRAVAELERAILQLGPRQRFSVIFYNDEPIPLFHPRRPAGLLYATQPRRIAARRWIRGRTADGDTLPQEALRMALHLRPDVVFFLTDGEIPRETATAAERYNLVGTTIHTTGFTSRQGEVLLQRIARKSGGTYRYIE